MTNGKITDDVPFFGVKNAQPSQTKVMVFKKSAAGEDEEVLDELPLILTGHCKADFSLHAIIHADRFFLLWK